PMAPNRSPAPEQITISQLLNGNLSGPRRYGYGTIREHLLGLTAVLPDGRVIHNGGKVVKNVAGFDLCKPFVGSRSTLGVSVAAGTRKQTRLLATNIGRLRSRILAPLRPRSPHLRSPLAAHQ